MAPKKILLVEDDEYLSRVYERAFRLQGHALIVENDGEVAWRSLMAMQDVPAVIILDVMLPTMDGEALLKATRGDTRFKDVPIAMFTNSFHEEDEKYFLSLGANLFMVKINQKPSDVVQKIEALIQTHATPKDMQ